MIRSQNSKVEKSRRKEGRKAKKEERNYQRNGLNYQFKKCAKERIKECADEDEKGKFTLKMVVKEGIYQGVSSRLRLEG